MRTEVQGGRKHQKVRREGRKQMEAVAEGQREQSREGTRKRREQNNRAVKATRPAFRHERE